jgi:hypothetical protein
LRSALPSSGERCPDIESRIVQEHGVMAHC